MSEFPIYKQLDQRDCGPTCLKMISKFYDKTYSIQYLRKVANVNRWGTSLYHICKAAEKIGLTTFPAKIQFKEFVKQFAGPCIVHWNQSHFVVVYKIKRGSVYVADPAVGKIKYGYDSFVAGWIGNRSNPVGPVLFLEPNIGLVQEDEDRQKLSISSFLSYFKRYKSYYLRIVVGMVVLSVITFILPFLTQAVVDIGITNQNIGFINLMLIAQLTLSLSMIIVRFVQSWISLYVGARISITIAVDYLAKVLKLKLSFLDSKTVGDLMQRMRDNTRIQAFISSTTLGTAFSFMNVIVFGIIMTTYSTKILLIFLCGSALYSLWILLFLKKRKEYDELFFEQSSKSQTSLFQIFNGLKDIKLNNYEQEKRREWERIQVKTYKIAMKQLMLGQYRQAGAFIIQKFKTIIISYIVAKAVIDGEITMGMMMSMQFIIGQMGSPISQLINFINSYQDAKISLERISEIHNQENEDVNEYKSKLLPSSTLVGNIYFNDLTFDYDGAANKPILDKISFEIPYGKLTAIVGGSGSGKTSLFKLLLKFYNAKPGNIKVGQTDLLRISHDTWRNTCGVVWQESFVFSDTIAKNIALTDEFISLERLDWATRTANIYDLITSLPAEYDTIIGDNGLTFSQGQKQRLLIARAIYKQPAFLLLDEATSSLDSDNEKIIIDNLMKNFKEKTIIFISHRLSAIRNADQILVLENGQIQESGSHDNLMALNGAYSTLMKNQM